MTRASFLIVLCVLALFAGATALADQPWYNLPKMPPPQEYGNILISRATSESKAPSVAFSHWRHRLKYTCRVCHLELGFYMKVNTTEITEEQNRNGEYCGACHNGRTAFGHEKKHCKKCHNDNIAYGSKYFRALNRLHKDQFGNRIDWVKALERGQINPRMSILDDEFTPMPFEKEFGLNSKWSMVPPAVFSHKVHLAWLDCSECHPDVFKIQKNSTQHFDMDKIIEGKFCGACHLNVAFPLDDCNRCHPKIRKE